MLYAHWVRVPPVFRGVVAALFSAAWPIRSAAAMIERIAPAMPIAAAPTPLGGILAPLPGGILQAPTAPLLGAALFPAPEFAAAQSAGPMPGAEPAPTRAAAAVIQAPSEQERQAALKDAQALLDGLLKHIAGRREDSYAHAVPPEELAKIARGILQKDNNLRPLSAAARGADDPINRRMLDQLAELEKTQAGRFGWHLRSLYRGLHRAFELDLSLGARVEISRLLHSLTAEYLARVERENSLPASVRGVAAKAARYVEDDRLLAAFAWGAQETARIAAARQAVLKERVDGGRGRVLGTSAFDPSGGWHPPAPDANPPAKPGKGVVRETLSMQALAREFQDKRALFEVARGRRDAALRLRLSPAGRAREGKLWKAAVRTYALYLDYYEDKTSRMLNNSIARGFGQVDIRGRPIHVPTHPGLSFGAVKGGYRLDASFETEIADPAVIAAFRRSIESYWKGRFEEDGRNKTFEARVSVRALAAGEAYSSGALRLTESGKTSAYTNDGGIALGRNFRFHVPAHEFGHVLGLPDEYINEYLPEAMAVRHEQDRASVMANEEGLVLPRHFAQAVRLLKEAGKLGAGRQP